MEAKWGQDHLGGQWISANLQYIYGGAHKLIDAGKYGQNGKLNSEKRERSESLFAGNSHLLQKRHCASKKSEARISGYCKYRGGDFTLLLAVPESSAVILFLLHQ